MDLSHRLRKHVPAAWTFPRPSTAMLVGFFPSLRFEQRRLLKQTLAKRQEKIACWWIHKLCDETRLNYPHMRDVAEQTELGDCHPTSSKFPGLATGLPHCTEAGSLPCALRVLRK